MLEGIEPSAVKRILAPAVELEMEGILSIVVDEKKHILRKNFYATSSSKIPSTNFLPDNTMGMIEDPVNLLQVF